MVPFRKLSPNHLLLRLILAPLLILLLVPACESGPWQERCASIDNDQDAYTARFFGEGSETVFLESTKTSGTGHVHDLMGIEQFYDASIGGGVTMKTSTKMVISTS